MRTPIWILTGFLLFLGACAPVGSETSGEVVGLVEDITFQPIDAIIDSPLEVTNFANDGTATLPIRTSVPVACTVVYGQTEAFGSLTLDQDMAGGTHSDHNPLLQGLEPETEYFFRVQGVDDEGVVYLSEVMTFTTPPRDTGQVENLASPLRGADVVGFSSAFGGAGVNDRWGPGMAFDDNPNTEWSTDGDGNQAWVEVQLAGPARVDTLTFHTRSMSDGSSITDAFTVTTDRGETFGPFQVAGGDGPASFEVDFTAEKLRFDLVETTGGNTGAVDIGVYGSFLES
jgi:hypothetical protein